MIISLIIAQKRYTLTMNQPSSDPLSEQTLDQLEAQFPQLFQVAITQVGSTTLAQGLSVLERAEQGLVEIFPDGSSKFIEPLNPWFSVIPGEKRVLP